jgi:hypothetical protein
MVFRPAAEPEIRPRSDAFRVPRAGSGDKHDQVLKLGFAVLEL